MVINSLEFIVFVAATVLVYFLMPKKIKWVILLLASYIFYFSNSTKLIVFLLITTLSVYLVALRMGKIDKNAKEKIEEYKTKLNENTANIEDAAKLKENEKEFKKQIKHNAKKHKKAILLLGILINLGILIFLKYSYFLGNNFNSLLSMLHINTQLPLTKFILPLGISYYTLQAISYIVDVYREKISPDKNIGKVALFLSFFPQIVEGPIGRYDKLAGQLYEPHAITYKNLTYGAQLMLWGYFKKMVLADRVAMYANTVFNNYASYSGLAVALGIITYTIQIYAEFSGGIDIVRGVAEIFGINMDQNFTRPFFSKSVDEFWRRWNITLGTWLKDYVFYPVSLSKLGMKITNGSINKLKNSYIAKIIPVLLPLLCVWLCNGFWHGSGWKYIVYGLYYFAIMLVGKFLAPIGNGLIKVLKINTKASSWKWFQIIRTTIFVCFGMLIFRADNLGIALSMFKSIFTTKDLGTVFSGQAFLLGGTGVGDIIISIICLILIFATSLYKEKGNNIRDKLAEQNLAFRWLIFYLLIFSIIIFGIYGRGYDVQSFIYGQF